MAESAGKGKRFILVVDNDMAVLKQVENTLRRNDYEVHLATDGALAINRALASPPEVVISAVEMPLLDGFKLCQLLRTNPITRDIPFVFLTSKETSPQRLGQYLRPFDEFLLKPFKEEELLGRITGLLMRMEKVEEVAVGEKALLGTLSEITLMDLLQILRMNRRSGFLDLEQEGRLATVFIREGEVVNAKLGKFKGEKAFFRLLDWNRGKFEFRPQAVETEVLIERPGENLILEGLRQLDEVNKIKETLFAGGRRLELVKHFQGPPEKLRPVTREVIKLLDYFSGLEDIMDQSSFNDLEICQTLQVLIEKEIIDVSAGVAEGEEALETPLLSLEEALKLSYQLGIGREETSQASTGKLLLFTSERKLLKQLLEGLSRHKEFKIDAGIVLDPAAKSIPLGGIGTVQILEGTDLSLYSFPSEASYQPLWEPLSQGSLGNLILLGEGNSAEDAARFCDNVLRQPFLLCGPGRPEGVEKAALGWEPSVPWNSIPLGDGRDDGYRQVFRALFSLILNK
jgi:DNA-binding response OmpR family regulator